MYNRPQVKARLQVPETLTERRQSAASGLVSGVEMWSQALRHLPDNGTLPARLCLVLEAHVLGSSLEPLSMDSVLDTLCSTCLWPEAAFSDVSGPIDLVPASYGAIQRSLLLES